MTTFQSQVEVCIGYMSNCFSLQKVEAALRPPFYAVTKYAFFMSV